jgi:ABC-2 type transport system permease protein
MHYSARRSRGALRSALRLFGKYISFNLRSGMEYRVSFLVQVFAMALNNTAFIFFWMILFSRIGGSIAGYGFEQVMYLWAMIAAGFGLSAVLFGNTFHLSRVIYSGELDVYLLQPKPVLANVAASRMIVSGWGDVGYGVILFLFTQPLTPVSIAFFVAFSLLTALVFTAVLVIYHSLTFWMGNAEGIAGLAHEAMISFTLYPGRSSKGRSGS